MSNLCRVDLNHSATKVPSGASVREGSTASFFTSCQKSRKRLIAVASNPFVFWPAQPSGIPASFTRLPYIRTVMWARAMDPHVPVIDEGIAPVAVVGWEAGRIGRWRSNRDMTGNVPASD